MLLPDVVEGYIRSRFAGEAIADIVIEPAGDVDGEAILNVRIVFTAKPDTSRLRNLVRNVRSDINRLHAFPVFSFASRNTLVV